MKTPLAFLLLVMTLATAAQETTTNVPSVVESPKLYAIRTITTLADKKETAKEIAERDMGNRYDIHFVKEIETWKPSDTLSIKTIIVVANPLTDTTKVNVFLFYPTDKYNYGEFLLDSFTSYGDLTIEDIFTANFDEDEEFEIGLILGQKDRGECRGISYTTFSYNRPQYLGVYWEFTMPIFGRNKDDRFDGCDCMCWGEPYYTDFDTQEGIIDFLSTEKK